MKFKVLGIFLGIFLGWAGVGQAHFLVLLPSDELVAQPQVLRFDILFTHPMEQGPVMEMALPVQFAVVKGGKQQDLRSLLQPIKLQGKTAYAAQYSVQKPGDHIFFMEPAPYWEPAEQKMIVHYTKVVVDSMGAADSWAQPVDLPVEIEPLVRPYGLWTGNLFQGIVRYKGKPLSHAEVEVEYYNKGRKVAIPGDPFVTQVVRADANGVFSYAMPKAGWWGFAALVEGEEQMTAPTGKKVPVELGGLIWVRTREMK